MPKANHGHTHGVASPCTGKAERSGDCSQPQQQKNFHGVQPPRRRLGTALEALARRWGKPSTYALVCAFRARGGSWWELLHGYVYLRFPYFYIGMGKGTHPLARWLGGPLSWLGGKMGLWNEENFRAKGGGGFADSYHGKVLRAESARTLINVRRDISLPKLERVLPYSEATDILLQHPDHIALLNCPCRQTSPHPCTPVDVCIIVGEPFVSFVLEHHPDKSRKVTREEAVRVVEAENKRGHVTHAFFKEAMLGRYYAICNCCSCCCGAMQAQRNGIPMLEPSGYLAVVDAAACVGCGACGKKCQFSAIAVQEGVAVVDASACMGCGACRFQCAKHAIRLERDEHASEPLEVDLLLQNFAGRGA